MKSGEKLDTRNISCTLHRFTKFDNSNYKNSEMKGFKVQDLQQLKNK